MTRVALAGALALLAGCAGISQDQARDIAIRSGCAAAAAAVAGQANEALLRAVIDTQCNQPVVP